MLMFVAYIFKERIKYFPIFVIINFKCSTEIHGTIRGASGKALLHNRYKYNKCDDIS